jgi:hypothetical protein
MCGTGMSQARISGGQTHVFRLRIGRGSVTHPTATSAIPHSIVFKEN